jgi:hypothetical protein
MMKQHELEQLAAPEQLSAALDLYQDQLRRLHHMHHDPRESVRELTYKGHHIRIVTSYRIELDGKPVTGHFLVNNAGQVHYHAIPNQEFPSAVDVIKRIVDLSEALGGADEGSPQHPSHQHGE